MYLVNMTFKFTAVQNICMKVICDALFERNL